MNELILSKDINVITAEINSYKNVAGQAIYEIGRRLKHVKENDLAFGEFGKWLEKIDIHERQAQRLMKVASELKINTTMWSELPFRNLYEIATLPEEQREQSHTIPSTGEQKTVDEMTVRELREVKKALKESEQKVEELESREPEVIEKEVIPEDYERIKGLYSSLKNTEEIYENQNKELRNELKNYEKMLNKKENSSSELEAEQKKLEHEANIETLEIVINIQSFLKDSSLSAYRLGALAHSDEDTKNRIKEHVKMLKDFTKNLEIALDGRIKI